MTDVVTYWPVLVSLVGLAAGVGAALVKIADLRERVNVLEKQVNGQLAQDLSAIKADIRELMTLMRERSA